MKSENITMAIKRTSKWQLREHSVIRKQCSGQLGTLTKLVHVGVFQGEPVFVPTDGGGQFLDVRFEHSDMLWPWSGFLALYVYVKSYGSAYNGTASGEATFTIVSPPMPGETEERTSLVKLPIKVNVIPTPPRCVDVACLFIVTKPTDLCMAAHPTAGKSMPAADKASMVCRTLL